MNKTATEIIAEHEVKICEIVENAPKFNETVYRIAYEMAIDYIVDNCPKALIDIEPDKAAAREILSKRFLEDAKMEIFSQALRG